MNKRGLQHVEFVLSFVIFVGFLIFALYFFSPFSGNRVVESVLFYTMDSVKNDVSTELNTFSIDVNDSVNEEIVGIQLNVPEVDNSRVVDSSGNILKSYFDGNNVFVDRNGNDFFVIELSDAFPKSENMGGSVLDISNYTISSSDKRTVLSELKFADLVERYNLNYEDIKKEFNSVERGDFAFSLVFPSGDKLVAEQTVPEGLEVFSDSKKFETIRLNGNIKFADLIVKVW